MTILFSSLVAIPAGDTSFPPSGAFPVPDGLRNALISFDSAPFPAGVTTVDIFLSFDGGVTFPSQASSTFGPKDPSPKAPSTYFMSFETALQPTHVKARVSAPSAFSTNISLTAQ